MLQVAAYCRVSTDKEDQANSFEAQQRYFREYIQRQPDWELQGIYIESDQRERGDQIRATAYQPFNLHQCGYAAK